MVNTKDSLNKLRLVLASAKDRIEIADQTHYDCSLQSLKRRTAIIDLHNDVAGASAKLEQLAEQIENNFEKNLQHIKELVFNIREDLLLITLKFEISKRKDKPSAPVYLPGKTSRRLNEDPACEIATYSDALKFVSSTADNLEYYCVGVEVMLEEALEMEKEEQDSVSTNVVRRLKHRFRSAWYIRWIVVTVVAFSMYFLLGQRDRQRKD